MNVTTLIDVTGEPVERYTYHPYGQVMVYDGTWTTERPTSAYDNEVLYCGYRLDRETGLYHVRHRVYHPLLGRWMQRDPLEYGDGLNLYQYCVGNPVNLVDPSGLIFPIIFVPETMDPRPTPAPRGETKPQPPSGPIPENPGASNLEKTWEGLTSGSYHETSVTVFGILYGAGRSMNPFALPGPEQWLIDRLEPESRKYLDAAAGTGRYVGDIAIIVGPVVVEKICVKGAQSAGPRMLHEVTRLGDGIVPTAIRTPVKSPATWANPKTLADHFERHGKDFGVRTPQEYVQASSDFLRNSQVQRLPTKIGLDGTIRVYDPKTNTFGSYTAGGETRTFYKPDPSLHKYETNLDYWNAQPGVSPWMP